MHFKNERNQLHFLWATHEQMITPAVNCKFRQLDGETISKFSQVTVVYRIPVSYPPYILYPRIERRAAGGV
jgi:hypothetical protein